MKSKIIPVLLFLGLIPSVYAENLLTGDTGVETEYKNMTHGTWTNLAGDGKDFFWDEQAAFEGKRSIRLAAPVWVSLNETGRLPRGKYVFSFYARADRDNVHGFISCSGFVRGWWRKRVAGRQPVILNKEWKRFSYVFDADGHNRWVPEFGLTSRGSQAWFDAFQLEKGTKPGVWVRPEAAAGLTQMTRQEGNVWHPGEKIRFQAAARIRNPDRKYLFRILGIDWEGKNVFTREMDVVPDKDGYFSTCFDFPSQIRGWFRVEARLMRGKETAASDFCTLAVVCKPVPTVPGLEPFGGAAGGKRLYQAMRRMGVGWLEWVMDWKIVERIKGEYDYKWLIPYGKMIEMKKKGFFNKVLYVMRGPDWEYLPEEAEAAGKLKLDLSRFPFKPEALPGWRNFVADSMKRYGPYMDQIEIGGELDAMFGCNIYFKNKYPQHVRGNFVYGPLLDRYTEIFNLAADEILRVRPGIRLSSIRPSDVDARYQYDYTKNVLQKTGKRTNLLGLDCYPQPRWIGPGQPPSGHASTLLGKNVARAREIMKQNAAGDNIFVSEYGYFIDYLSRHDLNYQREQANRLASSFIVARANGAKSFFWHMVASDGSNSHEANRYLMSISDRRQPFMAVAAYSAAVELLSNVIDTRIIKLTDDMEICVFEKHDGTAAAAVWSINPEYTPEVSLDADTLRITDMVGKPLERKNAWKLSENPCYVWREVRGKDNFAELCRIMNNIRIREKMPVTIDIRQSFRNELRVIMNNKSRIRTQQGEVTAGGKTYKVKIPPGDYSQLRIGCREPKMELSFAFEGYQPLRMTYEKPFIFKIPRVKSSADTAAFGTLKIMTPDHIEPVDFTTWSGKDDLSVEIRLGHDGKNLYLTAVVTDDRHFNNYDDQRIWKGDCLQLALDPKTNSFGKRLFRQDDYLMTFALAGNWPQWIIHEGPNRQSLRKYSTVGISRDEKNRRTVYSLTFPLRYIDRVLLKPKTVFGMNMVFFDDDSGSGADYWMFLTRGLTGTRDCSLYQLFELE